MIFKESIALWWNFEDIIHFELVPNDLYCAKLEQMYAALYEKYPGLINSKRVLLQQDKAKPHTTKLIMEKIKNLDAVVLLPHLIYSSNIASSNYHF